PMLTTAAGTIPPAKVFIIGAGVAGLQAIATARRLGANVEAFDIRAAAKAEVESLGAKFVQIELEEDTEAGGGYAKEISAAGQERIRQMIHDHVEAADVVITTAQVPGKKAPRIVTRAMIEAMRPGAVVLDMAVEQGGNCELTESGKTIDHNGVTLIGPVNLPGDMAIHTSQMYARNLAAFLNLLVKDGALHLNFDDEIIRTSCITHDGKIVQEQVQSMLNA
ncbi:NAD(P)(+) transhydrogenase (Re/Si-specific) subunit alpha, partial [candidate division KSB1 bacterium]|nr:NAD(P)(+) transhydrogenase (Re/Si-specific) subunit alpha [candidate division KSB1 bacterium]